MARARQERHIAIVLLAGSGRRFATPTPKQFVKLGGKPLFQYATEKLLKSPFVDEIVFVLRKSYFDTFLPMIKEMNLKKPYRLVQGGFSRCASVANAIDALREEKEDCLVLIQDGDRPNLKESYIALSYDGAKLNGAAIVARKESDSVFISKEGQKAESYLNRNEIYHAETPQCFRLSLLRKCYLKSDRRNFTDEGSMVLELLDISPQIIISEPGNLKINDQNDANVFLTSLKKPRRHKQ